jgi:hypothetical protein
MSAVGQSQALAWNHEQRPGNSTQLRLDVATVSTNANFSSYITLRFWYLYGTLLIDLSRSCKCMANTEAWSLLPQAPHALVFALQRGITCQP